MAAASSEHRLQHGGWQHVVRRCSLGCIAWRKCRSEEFNADFRSSHCMCSAGVRGGMGGRSSGAGASSPNAWGVAPGACASWQGCLDSHCNILQHSAAVVSMDAASTPAYILAVHTAHAHAAHAANGQHAAAGFCPCASKVFQRSNHRAVGPLGCMCASCFDPSNVCNEQVSPDS